MPKTFAVICKQCGAGFETKRQKQEYCSDKCRQIAFQKKRKQQDYEKGWRDALMMVRGHVDALPDVDKKFIITLVEHYTQ